MSKDIIVILAPSRCGKDSLANLIGKNQRVANFKWADFVKRMVETAYDLNYGDLEKPEIKAQIAPGTNVTFSDILVDFFHKQSSLADPLFFKRKPLAALDFLMEEHRTVVSTDTRNHFECRAIVDQAIKHDYKIHLVILARESVTSLTSDIELEVNYQYLERAAKTHYALTVPDCKFYIAYLDLLCKELVKHLGKGT